MAVRGSIGGFTKRLEASEQDDCPLNNFNGALNSARYCYVLNTTDILSHIISSKSHLQISKPKYFCRLWQIHLYRRMMLPACIAGRLNRRNCPRWRKCHILSDSAFLRSTPLTTNLPCLPEQVWRWKLRDPGCSDPKPSTECLYPSFERASFVSGSSKSTKTNFMRLAEKTFSICQEQHLRSPNSSYCNITSSPR